MVLYLPHKHISSRITLKVTKIFYYYLNNANTDIMHVICPAMHACHADYRFCLCFLQRSHLNDKIISESTGLIQCRINPRGGPYAVEITGYPCKLSHGPIACII